MLVMFDKKLLCSVSFFIHSFIMKICCVPLQGNYSGMLPIPALGIGSHKSGLQVWPAL